MAVKRKGDSIGSTRLKVSRKTEVNEYEVHPFGTYRMAMKRKGDSIGSKRLKVSRRTKVDESEVLPFGTRRMVVKRKGDPLGSKRLKDVRRTKVDESEVHPFGTWADLPYDIFIDILLRLPIRSILSCRCVCRSWRSIVLDPYFAQLYSQLAPFTILVRNDDSKCISRTLHLLDLDETQNLPSDKDCCYDGSCKDPLKCNCACHTKRGIKLKLPLRDPKMVIDTMPRRRGKKRSTIVGCKTKDNRFDIVGSYNGLLCLCDLFISNSFLVRNPSTLVVCNPLTGEFVRLPESEKNKVLRCGGIHFGLGYVKKTNEYKMIRIYACVLPQKLVVEVHTLGTRSWRNIEYPGPYWWRIQFPTCLNGSLHWLVSKWRKASILCFDLESETLNPLPCPSTISSLHPDEIAYMTFGELKESLCICHPCENAKNLKFWTMKKYGDGQSWSEVLKFNVESLNYRPDMHSCEKKVFFGHGMLLDHDHGFFMYFDLQKHLVRFLKCGATSFSGKSARLESISYIPNLIRLKDIVKGNDVEVINFHSWCATIKLREDEDNLYPAMYLADKEDMSLDFKNF